MMEKLSLEKENITKDIIKLQNEKELDYTTIKYVRHTFGLEKETNTIKYYQLL